jgi:hypothetical protein
MAFTRGKMGFGEARLKVLHDLIVANIEGATAQLQRTEIADTSPLVSALFGGALTEQAVQYGEIGTLWPREEGCLRITVCSGGFGNGEIARTQRAHIDASTQRGVHYDYITDVLIHLHPDCWALYEDGYEMTRVREIALERLADWISWGVLTYGPNLHLITESQCYETQGGSEYDALANCRIVSLRTGVFGRGFAGSIGLYGVQAVHMGDIE